MEAYRSEEEVSRCRYVADKLGAYSFIYYAFVFRVLNHDEF